VVGDRRLGQARLGMRVSHTTIVRRGTAGGARPADWAESLLSAVSQSAYWG
jgi:hypothetical protein